jgi:hypothetical protein
MAVEDVYVQNRRLSVRLREKGAKRHACRATTISMNPSSPTRRRAATVGIETKLGNHCFRATGITHISGTARHWKWPPRWQITPQPADTTG